MPEQHTERLHTAGSLNRGQYDAMCIRAALASRRLPTTSLPGQVVFTSEQSGQPLAFNQLSSYGATYGGFGLVKTSRRAWQVLRRSGVPVPQSQTFAPDAQAAAAAYAQRIGLPAVVSSLTGTYRRTAHDADSLSKAFGEVAERVKGQVLVHSTVPGELIRLMVQGQQVLAVRAQGHRGALHPEDLDPALLQLAVAAVEAIPGLDLAAVTISVPTSDPRLKNSDVDRQPLVERVMRSPHLRDFAAGSRREALRLADQLVQNAARELDISLAESSARISADLVFTGVPDPDSFVAELAAMVNALGRVTVVREPQSVADGAELSMRGPASDVALVTTQSIAGFANGDSAHLVHCRPASGD
ncbi:hypothetical protein [Garicola koreensis]|uniref:Uncharacterized protein n=1 Tax=Garicola koreensis TaxID=1262554 RepID=A0A7W5XNW9_9MICC|nr:hypothetical protein [Garicola koreensis]MBB3667222.1 hypothetical protein [Garicola koreensis]